MAKNKVEVFLKRPEGDEQILLDGINARKIETKPDDKVKPCILINRSNQPEYYIYDNEKRMISPKAELPLGDEDKLEKKSLNKNLIVKKVSK